MSRAQGQPGQPIGQVPFTGATHCGFFMATLESTKQQSCPPVQHVVPQQKVPMALHSWGGISMHTGIGSHVPLLQ
jgi:hypothetical protein